MIGLYCGMSKLPDIQRYLDMILGIKASPDKEVDVPDLGVGNQIFMAGDSAQHWPNKVNTTLFLQFLKMYKDE